MAGSRARWWPICAPKATTSTRWWPTCRPTVGRADTPAPGWTIAHQIAHLLWTDRVALTAVTDEAGFAAVLAEAAKDPTGFVDAGAEELAALPPAQLLADWRADPRPGCTTSCCASPTAASCRGSDRR